MWNSLRLPSLAPALAAALIGSIGAQDPENPDPGENPNQLTSFSLKQVVPGGTQYDGAWKLPGRDSYVMTPDRTGQVSVNVSITHTFPSAPSIKLIDGSGTIIGVFPSGGGTIHVPSIKYDSYLHAVVFAPDGTPISTRSIVTGDVSSTDGPGPIGGMSSTSIDIPSVHDSSTETGKGGEGSAGEDSGSCSSCQSCDLTTGRDSGDVSADGEDGQFTATQPAGTSMQGDSQTRLGAQVNPTEGIQQEDIKVNGTGDASIARDVSNNNRVTSVTTDTAHTKVESTTVNGDSAVKLSQWRSAADATANPNNPYRVITYINSDANEITRTNALSGGTTVTSVWKYDSVNSKWEFIEGDLRKKELTVESSGDPTIRIERHKLYERNAAGTSWILVSDVRKTFKKFSFAWKKTKSEVLGLADNPLVTKWEYWGPEDITGDGGATNGRTLLKSVTYPDGSVEEHNYSASGSGGTAEYVHKINTSFQGATPGSLTKVNSTTGNGNSRSNQTKVGGDIVSQSTSTWTGTNSNVRTVQKSTGPSAFEEQTSTHVTFGSDFGGKPTASAFADGTGSVSSYSRSGSGGTATKVTTSAFGQMSNGQIVSGTQSQSTTNKDGVTVLRTTEDIESGVMLESSRVPTGQTDAFGRPLKVEYHVDGNGNPAYWETAEYACCGLAKHTDKFGVVTQYAYDGLKRQTRVNQLGVTRHTVYDGLTVRSHRYAESVSGGVFTGSANSGNEISNSERDLSGTIRYSRSRSPQDGTLITDSTITTLFRNPAASTPNPHGLPAGIGRRVATVLVSTTDDDATPSETTDYYLDGRVYQTTGNLSPSVRYAYAVGELNYKGDSTPEGHGSATTTTILDSSGNPRESSTTYRDRSGKTLATVSSWSGLTEYFYTNDRLTKIIDADGVTRLYGYNGRGERVLDVLDVDADGAIDYGSDQVSFSETKATTRSSTPVLRTTVKVWKPGAGINSGTIVSYRDVTPHGLQSWQDTFPTTGSGYGTSSSTLNLGTHGDAIWTATSVSADGVISRDYYSAGRKVAGTLWEAGSTPDASAPASITNVATAGFISGTAFGYDTIGRPTTSTDSRTGTTTTTYGTGTDVIRDEVASVTDPGSRVTSFTYDHRGRRKTVNLPDSLSSSGANLTNVTTTNHFIDGSLKLVDGGQTYKTGYTYDYAGRMESLTTYGTETATTTWNYSATTGRLISKTYPDGYDTDAAADPGPTYHYTAAGRLKKRIWARGNTTRYDYDAGGRLTYTRYFTATTDQTTVDAAATGNDSITPDSAFIYDALGRLEEATNAHSSIEYGYHADLLTLATESISVDPDGSGTRAAVTRTFERGRDSLLRPNGYLFKNGGTVEAEVAYGYHASHGRLEQVSGVHAGSARGFSWAYEPEAYGLPSAITGPQHVVALDWKADRDVIHSRANSERYNDNTLFSSYEYAVNDIGQRTGVSLVGSQFHTGGNGIVWGYDAMGQVVSADRSEDSAPNSLGDRGYLYDGIGNRLKSSRNTTDPDSATGSDLALYKNGTAISSPNGANALNQYGRTTNYGVPVVNTYDADGNQLNARFPGGYTGSHEWDGENRLIRHVVGTTHYHAYDPFGRRVAKYYYDSGSSMVGNIYFYDGWKVAAECSIASSTYPLDRTYTWGPDLSGTMQGAGGVGGLLAVEIESGSDAGVYYPTYDGNGNVSEYLDASADVVAHFEYDPFGEEVVTSGSKVALFNYRFSTKPKDITGYYYYGYRFYDPVMGRWQSRDPKGEAGGVGLYGFVRNDSLIWVDPLGLDRYLCIQSNLNGNYGGHAGLALIDTEAGTTDTYATWPDDHPAIDKAGLNNQCSDVRKNFEKDNPADYAYKHCRKLSDSEHEKFKKAVEEYQKWSYCNNCSSFASDVFLEATGIDVDADDWAGFESPGEVGENIVEMNGGNDSNENIIPGGIPPVPGAPTNGGEGGTSDSTSNPSTDTSNSSSGSTSSVGGSTGQVTSGSGQATGSAVQGTTNTSSGD